MNISRESKLILIGLLIAGSAFVVLVSLGSSGIFRHAVIFFPEVIPASIAFQNINGELKIIGLKGNLGVNPTLIARTDSTYILTVYNQDNMPHQFYIDGLNLKTKLLTPNDADFITVKEFKQGNYRYYDIGSEKTVQLGIFKVFHVG